LAHGKPLSYWLETVHNRDVRLRKKAVQTLGNIGPVDQAVIPALTSALKDPDVGVRKEAIESLVKMGPKAKEAVPTLDEISRHDANAKVKSDAEKAIQSIQK
jgi:HEAT repeat protein